MTLNNSKYIEILEFVLNGKPYREIEKLEGVSKNTVANLIKRLRATGSIFPSDSKKSIYDPLIQEIQDQIVYYLRLKRSTYNIRHKIKLTNKEIYLLLLAKGYAISYTKVNELIRFGKNIIKESFLNIIHLPGEAVEFDWGTLNIQIGASEKLTKVSLAVFSFPYSNFKKAYVLENSSGESFVLAFKEFIQEVGGIPPLFVLDNMRIARKFSSKKDADIRLTSLFEELCNHYDFKIRFCSPYCPNQKGNVENSVAVLKREFEKSYINSFNNIEDIREFVNDKISELNTKEHPQKNDSCENLFNHEKGRLLPLPNREYIYYHKKICKVNSNGMIKFNHNYYAVPEMYKGEKVIIKYNDSTIYILTKDKEEVLAKYTPAQGKKNQKFRIWYMLNKLKNKSNGFMYSKEYLSLSKPEKLILEKIFKNDCNEFLAFIELIKNRPRDLIRKFVYKFKDNLDLFTVDLLMNEMLEL